MELIDTLHWRYATKRMNGTKVPQVKINNILEAIRLSPSSYGLQPYTILVVDKEDLLKKIQPLAYNQPQIVEASHLLVFSAWTDISEGKIDEYFDQTAAERGLPPEALKDYKKMVTSRFVNSTADDVYNWSARQAYIALGTGLIAAANEKVDATPMEGFDPAGIDQLLGLNEKGLRSIALMAIGYRDAEKDFLSTAKKIRRKKEQLFIHL